MCMFEGVQSSWQAEEAAGEMLHVVHWAWQLGMFTANKKKKEKKALISHICARIQDIQLFGGVRKPSLKKNTGEETGKWGWTRIFKSLKLY